MGVKSRIWDYSKEDFEIIVNKSNSIADIIRHLDMAVCSGTYKTIKRRISKENISITHFVPYLHNKNIQKEINLNDVLIENSTYNRRSIKRRLFSENDRCAICKNEPLWQGKKLVLRLDHINGIRNDNRRENLRLVCPNCDSQLETFSGRNKRKMASSNNG